jgi:hypothetical protein
MTGGQQPRHQGQGGNAADRKYGADKRDHDDGAAVEGGDQQTHGAGRRQPRRDDHADEHDRRDLPQVGEGEQSGRRHMVAQRHGEGEQGERNKDAFLRIGSGGRGQFGNRHGS